MSSRTENYMLVLLCFTSFLVICNSTFYEPKEMFYLDCSSADLSSSKSSSSDTHKTSYYVVSKTNEKASTFNESAKACVHQKQFTYMFPMYPGPKFIRLHFNPISYSGFHFSKALFSVSVGHYTLLEISEASYSKRGFNDAADSYTIKEYCLNIIDHVLNVTFIPSMNVSDAYAFVNRIEVVSMPTDLYIRALVPLPLIGQPSPYYVKRSKALEMMHRLNVGGGLIRAEQDTGMFREWTPDVSFLATNESDTVIFHSHVQIKSSFFAPESIYASARTVAADAAVEVGGTGWLLPVDSGFYYLVRLHFCEISDEIKGVDQRVFRVYIMNQIAEHQADIFQWGHGAGIPVYKDYIVNFMEQSKGRKNLSLSIETSNNSVMYHQHPILNGLEIFKLSDSNNNLAGSFSYEARKPSNKSENGAACYRDFKILTKVFLCFFLILTISATIWEMVASYVKRQRETFMQSLCQSFSFDEIKLATNNFSDALILGAGGYGKVYKGSINGDADFVAVKRADPCSKQGLNEFQTEVFLLSQLRHCHLVSLVGCCKEKEEMILVYDYMANGALRGHLYNTKNPPLSWNRRLKICIGAAKGLHYLHTGAMHKIIHRDVKSTNILLDNNWVAKVSDFGLSKIGPNTFSQSKTHVTTMVKGTFGYLDPEYYKRQKLTEKSDVYSFGVVLLEVLCARAAVLQVTDNMDEEQLEKVSLADWALQCYRSGTIERIIDPFLQGKIDATCFKTFTDIASKCLADKGNERPSMDEVLKNLEQAWIQQEESACFQNDGNCGVSNDHENTAGELSVTIDVGGGVAGNDSSDTTPGVEFSDIIDPVGR